MAFLVLVGALQFVYCVLVGNYVSFLCTLSLCPSGGFWGVWGCGGVGGVEGRAGGTFLLCAGL